MKHIFFLKLSFLNTFKKKLRVIFEITGIALTSTIVIILFGLQIGLKKLVDTEISSADAKDVVTITQRNAQQIKLNDTQISKIQSISGVSTLGQSVGLLGNAIYHGINLNVPLYAITSDYLSMSAPKIITGSAESQPENTNIIVSSKVLDVFGIKNNEALGHKVQLSATITSNYASKVNDILKTKPQDYTIVSVIDRGSLPVIYMPIERLKQQGLDSVAQLKAQLTTPEKATAVRDSIEQMGLQTTSIQDTIDQINKLFDVINGILSIFCIVFLVITVSGTFTIISLTLMEETRQIGFLRITGLKHADVKILFIIQSIIITTSGAILGVINGVVGGFILNGIARTVASNETFSGDIIVFAIPFQPIIIILMLSVIVGWLVGLFPARRAVLIDPLKELRS